MKLWQKENTDTHDLVEQFTVGRDLEFDIVLAPYDVQGTIAHATMLHKVGLLDSTDYDKVMQGLQEIKGDIENGLFEIEKGVEDVHSQVELSLTRRIGDAGKKIHTGRSRNDQVAIDIKLYLKDQIQHIRHQVMELFDLLLVSSEKYQSYSLPGYTHLQLGMPSSFGLWFGAYAESLVDDMEVLGATYRIVNKNPLGSGAGYGSNFPLDRSLTTELLEMGGLNVNAMYAQMSRGKTERQVASAISTLSYTLSKLAMDCCLYMNQNFGFISFPDHLTTGSSIMPHKKNPDVFELIRGKCNRIQSLPNELTLLINNLPSGYHREMQLTKEILFPALEEIKGCFHMMCLMLSHIKITKDILADDKYKLLFTVDSINQLVIGGVPFRDAYKTIGDQVNKGTYAKPSLDEIDWTKAHEGSINNLCNDMIRSAMEGVIARFEG